MKTDELNADQRAGLVQRLAGAYTSLAADTRSTANLVTDMIQKHGSMFAHIQQVAERLDVDVQKPTDEQIESMWTQIVQSFDEAEQLRQDAWEEACNTARLANKPLPEQPEKRKMISRQFFGALVVEIWTNLIP
ncbi:MAG: hypothetical protein V4469_01170 [Patescibacteria group bacterium]